MKRVGIRVIIGLALVTLPSVQRLQAQAPTRSLLQQASLQLNGPLSPIFAGDLVALRSGLFRREGLELELEPAAADDADPVPLVLSGARTIGVTTAVRFALARAKGAPLVAFAAAYLESPVAFFTLESSPIRTPRDFVGRSIHVKAEDDSAIIYEALMVKLGLPRSQVRQTTLAAPLATLLKGELDVLGSWILPTARELEHKGVPYRIIRPANYGVHVPGTVYFATESTIRARPELVQRALGAIILGWERAYAEYDTSIPLIAGFREPPLAASIVRFDLDLQRNFVRPPARRFNEFDDAQWRALNQILTQQKLIRSPIDLSRAVTFEFLREAYRKSSGFGKQHSPAPPLSMPVDRKLP